jgi:hypothetical protein
MEYDEGEQLRTILKTQGTIAFFFLHPPPKKKVLFTLGGRLIKTG